MLAAAVIYVGAFFLLKNGIWLTVELLRTKGAFAATLVALAGAGTGVVKGLLLMRPFNRRNVVRISRLDSPRVWKFFSGPFFAALLVMILAGALLGGLTENGPWWQASVAVVDLVIGVALAVSGDPYFRPES